MHWTDYGIHTALPAIVELAPGGVGYGQDSLEIGAWEGANRPVDERCMKCRYQSMAMT